MGLNKWANAKIKNLKWFDMSLTKLSVVAFTLMVVKLWSPILYLQWYWYLVLFVVLAIRPLYVIYKK